MRLLLIGCASFALVGCDPLVSSESPLFSANAGVPEPGLWAMLEKDCAVPSTSAVGTWPECAAPFWVAETTVTYMAPKPVRLKYTITRGEPFVAQLEAPPARPGVRMPRYSYMAVRPEGSSPYRRGRVWFGGCGGGVERVIPEFEATEDPGCVAASADVVRRALAFAVTQDEGGRVVWIAP